MKQKQGNPPLPFRRRPGLLHVEAAIAALALSMPMAAGAQEIIINDDDTIASQVSTYAISSSDYDFLTKKLGKTLVPLVPGSLPPNTPVPIASNNATIITDWDQGGDLYSVAGGGWMDQSNVEEVIKNIVTINGASDTATIINGKVVGGVNAGQGTVGGEEKANEVVLNGGTVKDDIIGGLGAGDQVTEISHNKVTINGGIAEDDVAGGWSAVGLDGSTLGNANVLDNEVKITGGKIGGNVYGGYSQQAGNASGNTVTIDQTTAIDIGGGIVGGVVNGGSSTGKAEGNEVKITATAGGTIGAAIVGGQADGTGTVGGTGNAKNTITISNTGETALTLGGNVFGGKGITGDVQYNEVTLSGNVEQGGTNFVAGGHGQGNVSHNTVTVEDGFTGKRVYGGVSEYGSSGGSADENTVNIKGGKITQSVIGGSTSTGGDAKGNTINVEGTAQIAAAYGGTVSGTGDAFSGNTLNKKTADSTIGTAGNFETVAFGYAGDANIGTLLAATSKTVKLNTDDNDVTFNGVLSGAGNIDKIGTGTLTLSGDASNLTGAFSVKAGGAVLQDTELGGNVNVDNSGLSSTGETTIAGNLSVNATSDTATVYVADGTLTVNGTTGVTLTGGGADKIATLKLANDGDLSAAVTLGASSVLDVQEKDTAKITLAATTHSGNVITGNARNLEVTVGSGTTTFGGYFGKEDATGDPASATNLTIKGNGGTLELTAEQQYTGTTTVDASGNTSNTTLVLVNGGNGSINASSGLVLIGESDTAKAVFETAEPGVHPELQGLSGNAYSEIKFYDTLEVSTDKDSIFAGTLTGTDAIRGAELEKWGSGTLILSGNTNTSGASNVDFYVGGGSLFLQGQNASNNPIANAGVFTGNVLAEAHNGEDDAVFGLLGNAKIIGDVEIDNSSGNGDGPGILLVNTEGNKTGEHAIIDGDLDAEGASVVFVIDKPAYYNSSNPVLEVTGDVDVEDATIDIFSAAPLTNDTLDNLISALSINWDDAKSIYAQSGFLTEARWATGTWKAQATEQSKAVSEGFLGGIGLLSLGGDLINDKGIANAVSGVARSGGAGEAFAAIGGGQIKHKTGSHVDVSGKTLVAGFAAGIGSATVGAFLEYGDGDYDSHNSFSGGKVRGSGDTDYFGGGLLGRYEFATASGNKPYLEATARFGRLKNDFKTSDFDSAFASQASFDTKSNYYGLSFGGGHIWKLGADNALDVYGRYVWTRQAGDSVTVAPSDERVKFSAVDSHRVRVGARYSQGWGGSNQAYVGVAVEHEFDGEANAKVNGLKIDAPDLEGSTGIAEVGIVFTPTGNKGLTIDLGLQGYGGKRAGATGSAQLKYAF